MNRLVAAAFVIARRDFTATVFSRAFLLFLLGPLFPLLVGVLFGGIGSGLAGGSARPPVAVVATATDYQPLAAARHRLAKAFDGQAVVRLRRVEPAADADLLRSQLLGSRSRPVLGVLEGGLDRPRFTGSADPDGPTVRQLQLLIGQARATKSDSAEAPLTVTRLPRSAGSLVAARSITARAGQALLFLLTILLAGMLLSQLIEEKSNKVIEILAAAVPIEAIFVGKLFAMLAMSLIGIGVWTTVAVAAIALLASDGLGGLPPPAVGWTAFALLVMVYFTMSYLLLGAAFLGIGAQASTVREVQTLSMPVTMAQVVIFAIASAAVGAHDSGAGIGAALFPLSSPYAMIARAAERPELWPHLLAIPWQLLWVALILRLASRLFRASVLKSGPSRRWWRRRRSPA